MKRIILAVGMAAGVGAAAFTCGCSMFRGRVTESDVNKPVRMGAEYDYEDLRTLGQTVSDAVLISEFLKGIPAKPTFVIMGIQNRTTEHIDTKALTDTMRTHLLQSGKMNFVNEARREDLMKEQGFQMANATAESRVGIGKQLGASFMLTGSLTEIKKKSPKQVRVSKQEERYYQLTMEITDLESGLIVWTTQKERARTESKPLIGW